MRLSFVGIGIVCAWGLLAACSGGDDSSKAGSLASSGTGGSSGADGFFGTGGKGGLAGGSAASPGSGGSSASPGSGGSGVGTGSGPNRCPISTSDAGCLGEIYVGETIPLDIYVMFDQSGSMLNPEQGGITRMDAVRNAVGQFLQDKKSAGLGVGIGYFGYEPLGQATCDPADYSQPGVGIGLLPANAQPIIDNLGTRQPTGETPTGAAIRGACTYAKDWKLTHPGHETVILLVTDGKPEAPVTCPNGGGPCCPTLSDAVAAATDCRNGKPGLKTYVLGVGPLLDNLVQIAAAGGTDKAYLVSGGDVTQQVLDALNAIRAAATIPCELQIPPPPAGQTLDLTKVNVVHTTNACEVQTIVYRDTQTTCDGTIGGWYFDDATAPQKVVLCGKTCDDVSVPGGQLLFSLGCERRGPR